MEPQNHPRYVEVNERMSLINGLGATAITASMLVATWGVRSSFLLIAFVQAGVILFNTLLINRHLLRAWGIRAEFLRATVNLSTGLFLNHEAHWPFPAWFFLPYAAVAFDHLGPKVVPWTVGVFCTGQDLAALHDGVPWIYPLTFTAFAVFCVVISRARLSVIREMLLDADRQRHSIAKAHEDLQREIQVREHVEADLRRAQKLEAIGRLAAGVAHEINTPMQFINDNLIFLRDSVATLVQYCASVRSISGATDQEIRALEQEADLEFLVNEMPRAFSDALKGTAHVSRIVRAMNTFAHTSRSSKPERLDVNAALDGVATIAHGETKHVADVVLELGKVDDVLALRDDLHQVFLNLIVNAAHAIEDVVQRTGGRGKITLRTRSDRDSVVIEVEDTGCGIPVEIRDRVYDPFFTTKDVGRGTGQGLTLARNVIVDKYGGELTFESEIGRGTTFYVKLPSASRREVAA